MSNFYLVYIVTVYIVETQTFILNLCILCYMSNILNEVDKNHILDLAIKTQSMIVQGHIFSAGQFVEEMRHILENDKTYIEHK